MAQTVREVMTRNPVTIRRDDSAAEAARLMAQGDMGDVIVLDNGTVAGIVTDRGLVTVTPQTPVDQAVRLMRQHAVRRLPVVEKGQPVGVVSLGDLAMERDQQSALADISAAEGNT